MGSGENDQTKIDSSNENNIENDESVNVHFDTAREKPSSENPPSKFSSSSKFDLLLQLFSFLTRQANVNTVIIAKVDKIRKNCNPTKYILF